MTLIRKSLNHCNNMKREEILKKIRQEGGAWKPLDGVTLRDRSKEGNDTDGVMAEVVVDDDTVIFWLMGHLNAGFEFYVQGFQGLNKSAAVFNASQILAEAIDYSMPDSTLKVITKEVKVTANITENKLSGMVEAYEKILIGREFSAKSS